MYRIYSLLAAIWISGSAVGRAGESGPSIVVAQTAPASAAAIPATVAAGMPVTPDASGDWIRIAALGAGIAAVGATFARAVSGLRRAH